MASRTIPVEPFDLVVFGATGDLATRKIFPALYKRLLAGQMPGEARVIGLARSSFTPEGFREEVAASVRAQVGTIDEECLARLQAQVDYLQLDALGETGWAELAAWLGEPGGRIRAFYLSVAPRLFEPICERLNRHGVTTPESRIVAEKPFGHDFESARSLNLHLGTHFAEAQLFRIDHYLGKETVQNLMAVRFANALFEPLWNARFVDHVQITVAETIGVNGRGEYYDQAGALRDMVQNHLMQLLCLIAMEPPSRFAPDPVRDEKLKVIRALEPFDLERAREDTVRGQYRAGADVPSYAEDVGRSGSRTESFVAMKLRIANWRWSGTPFYLRTGKRLRARFSEIAIVFHEAPHSVFAQTTRRLPANVLVIRLQPDEGITLRMTIKEPGPGGMRLMEVPLDMSFADALDGKGLQMPDAYERLLMDVIRGDQTLFMRGDEVEAAWAWIDPIAAAWEHDGRSPQPYDPGTSGPEDALMLMHRDHRRWRAIGR
mgnify:CR=1 FL=1